MLTRADIIDALRTIGNGDIDNGKALLVALSERLIHAREKHPEFAKSDVGAWNVINDEVNELLRAVWYESPERMQDELLDVLATSVRFYNGEHGCKLI